MGSFRIEELEGLEGLEGLALEGLEGLVLEEIEGGRDRAGLALEKWKRQEKRNK